MALHTKRVVVGGAQYDITQLGAVAGRGLFKKFVTAMSPLLRDAVSGSAFKELQRLIGELPEDATFDRLAVEAAPIVGPYLIRTIEDLPQDFFEELCETFSQSTTVMAGKPATPQKLSDLFDEHFAGNYVGLLGWLFQCLKVNGFLANLGNASGVAQQPAPTP